MNVYLYQYILATGIIALHIIIGILIIFLITGTGKRILQHIKKYALGYALVLTTMAFIGSLGFSEGYHYEPCKLCWIQRIFHYPQILLFAFALKKHDAYVWTYSLWLSILGLIVGIYQVLIQFSPVIAKSSLCNINPSTADCSDVLIKAYGYITIPVMSVTVFLGIIVLYIIHKKNV